MIRLVDTTTLEPFELCIDISEFAVLSDRREDQQVAQKVFQSGAHEHLKAWAKVEACCAVVAQNGP